MLVQVSSTSLAPSKYWYVLNDEIGGSSFRKWMDNAFFRLFPDEFHKIPFCKLSDNNGSPLDPNLFGIKYRKCDVLVASTLGLCGGLIRQRDLNDQGYLASDSFKRIAQAINSHCAITGLSRNGASSNADTNSCLKEELNEAKDKIMELQSLLAMHKQMSTNTDEKSAKSPKRKKMRLSKKSAGEILRTLEDVCDRHKASVSSVIGHLCTHDPAKQPREARNIISEIVTAVTERKGVKRGLEALVPDVLQQYLHQFRVPDWVLLYFKLEAKIPDEGWQTMMNLTKLGRTKVSHNLFPCLLIT